MEEGGIHPLFPASSIELGRLSSSSDLGLELHHQLLDSQVFGLGPNFTIGFSESQRLQVVDLGTSQPPQSHKPIPHNKSL